MATVKTLTIRKDVAQPLDVNPQVKNISGTQDHLLIVSPYLDHNHLLDLRRLDQQSQLFALALQSLKSTDEHYATTEYGDAFQWGQVMTVLKSLALSCGIKWQKREFYVVEFRSCLKDNIDRELLFTLDRESHREATESGGLLKYWFGTPDSERRNLATCLWTDKDHAMRGGKGPWHKKARGIIPQMYKQIDVHGLVMTIEENVQGWTFEPFR